MTIDTEIIPLLPRIELHLHLDCSLSSDVVERLWPDISEMEFQKNFIAPDKYTDLADFLRCASSGIELMQTGEGLREVVKGLFTQLQRDNVIYTEIRFAPLLHLQKGLAPEEVVEIVADSVSESTISSGKTAGLILCTLRHDNEAQSLQTIKLVERYISHTQVAGFDIASDEAGYPIDSHKSASVYVAKNDIPRTAHAGEAKGADSVWETLRYFKPQRIGHGVRSIKDEQLIEHLIEKKIHLEICSTSNVQTNIYKQYSDHPINLLFDAGVSVSVNTDARSLVNVSLTDEYVKLANEFDWDIDHYYRCNKNALTHAFIADDEKEELQKVLLSKYSRYFAG